MKGFFPPLTSFPASFLTPADWEKVSVSGFTFSLEEALIQSQTLDVKDKPILLDTSSLFLKNESEVRLKKANDGSVIHFSYSDLEKFISELKPKALCLSKNALRHLSTRHPERSLCRPERSEGSPECREMSHYVRHDAGLCEDIENMAVGVSCTRGEHETFDTFHERVLAHREKGRSVYAKGTFSVHEIKTLSSLAVVSSSRPMDDALLGNIYTQEDTLSLTNQTMEEDHRVFQKDCLCPACSEGLTRAYFAHLLKEVPFLAKRYLILHNLFAVYYS